MFHLTDFIITVKVSHVLNEYCIPNPKMYTYLIPTLHYTGYAHKLTETTDVIEISDAESVGKTPKRTTPKTTTPKTTGTATSDNFFDLTGESPSATPVISPALSMERKSKTPTVAVPLLKFENSKDRKDARPRRVTKNLFPRKSKEKPQPDDSSPLPKGISRETYPQMIDGKKWSASRLMTRQLKRYHARLGKKIQMFSGGGRRAVWRCTDYMNKKKQCERYGVVLKYV